jgi:PAS domain S-box-containing protein
MKSGRLQTNTKMISESLEEVRNQIIDRTLIVTSVLGGLAYLISLTRFFSTGFHFSFIIEFAVVLGLFIITTKRSSLSSDFKTDVIISLLILFTLSDAFNYGLFSSGRIYLILIPFFSIFYFSLLRTLIVFLASIFLFIGIGFFYHRGVLILPPSYEPSVYTLRLYPWIINAVHISVVGSIILLITRKFLITYSRMIANMEESNRIIAENERNYREIYNSTNEAIFLHNAEDGRIIDVNDVMLRMYGFNKKEDALKLSVNDLSADNSVESEEKAKKLIRKAVEEGPQFFEWTSKKKNGELFYSEISLRSTEIGGNGRVLAVLRDVTDKKLAQEALQKSEKKFREMAELLPETVWESDINGRVNFVNKHGLKQFGHTEQDIEKGYNIINSLVPEEREKAKANLTILLEEERGFGEDYTALRTDGTTFPVTIFTSVIRDNEKPVGFRGIVIDISRRKETEISLQKSEEKYRTLMESLNEVVMMVDNDDKVLFVNKKFTEKLGYEPDEIIGKIGYKHLVAEENQSIIKSANHNRLNKDIDQYEIPFIAKDGTVIDFLVSGAPIINSEGKTIGSIGAMIDITDKKKAERELEKYRNQLERLVKERTEELETANEELVSTNEEIYSQREELEATLNKLQTTFNQLIQSEKMASLGILAAGIAHEINNPLNFIKAGTLGLEEYIHENLKEHELRLRPMTQGIHSGVDRAANIVSSLKHYSRKENDNQISCDIHSIINHCLTILQNQFKHKVEIQKNYTSNQYNVNCNEGKLHQAFLNILDNAGQSIENNGLITITTAIQEKYFTISIKDNGCGIKEEDLDKITDPFFSTKEPGKGTGLGLSITQNIIEEHKGKLVFNSEVKKGTEVIISLPVCNP